jgi:hypothetical protein
MSDNSDRFDDGLGPDPINRGSGKAMGAGNSGTSSGGSYIDPSYEDALHIMGRAWKIPSPFEQRAQIMDDPDAAELARRLTLLRQAAGTGFGAFNDLPEMDVTVEEPSVGQMVQDFIAALQENPPNPQRLADMCRKIEQANDAIRKALTNVCDHPVIKDRLEGKGSPVLNLPDI